MGRFWNWWKGCLDMIILDIMEDIIDIIETMMVWNETEQNSSLVLI